MSYLKHKKNAPQSIIVSVITLSDTRTKDNDESGKIICEYLINNKHKISTYLIVKEDKTKIKKAIKKVLKEKNSQVIIINGGTGISQRDNTYEIVKGFFTKELPGFGEVFRYLSYEEIGSSAILSRASAGVCKNKILISIPGSIKAVKLAMEKIILPELGHLVYEANK